MIPLPDRASMRRFAFLLLVALITQGCGIKGPLYIATPEQKAQLEERKKRREAAQQAPGTQPAPSAQTVAPSLSPAVDPTAGPALSPDMNPPAGDDTVVPGFYSPVP